VRICVFLFVVQVSRTSYKTNMAEIGDTNPSASALDFEARLWATAGKMRGRMDASEYKLHERIIIKIYEFLTLAAPLQDELRLPKF
jgi:hypothetical protein